MSDINNPLGGMKINYWYKALIIVGAAIFILNGTGVLDRYPTAPIAFISAGVFFIGIGEWINHPPQIQFHGGRVYTKVNIRKNSALGCFIGVVGLILVIVGIYKFF
ncbi:hypothetical protein [Providencia rettgeri]|uniref:hypothetical protein n=1 Tax=Providencia rettgeri TaxID=587 RepID=UPI00235F894E|nr:hypothetical protein [Providencia rettgeri]